MTKKAEADTQVNLKQKLVAILKDLGPVEKAHRNPHFGYNYTSEGQMMALLGPRLAASGIIFTTSVEEMDPHYNDSNPKAGVYVTVKTLHTFHDTDTGEMLAVKSAGMGWDSGDKALPKAITGATKSALMKNFMVTDETDSENEVRQPDTSKQAQSSGHRPTTPYEEKSGDGDHASATDLLELKAFLTEQKIPDGFLVALLLQKGMATEGDTVASLKPGILRRCLSPNSKENLIKAWAAQKKGAAKKASRKTAEPEPEEKEVRTNEGDQRRDGARVFCQADSISPADCLAQDGYDNWREVAIHFGTQRGEKLGSMSKKSLAYWLKWTPKPHKGTLTDKDVLLDAALCLAALELGGAE